MRLVESNGNTDNAYKELADQHTKGTPDEERATSELLNGVEGNWGRAHVNESEDEGDQEGVGDGSGGLQERGGVVEDEVDTSPLLHHLERCSQDGTAQVGLLDPEATGEAVNPAGDDAGLGNDGALVLLVGDNLSQLDLDVGRVLGLSTKSAESVGCAVETANLDEVTWGIWQEHQATSEDDTPEELDGDGDTVGSSIWAALGGVGHAGSEQETDGDAELVTSNEGTTNLSGAL